AGFFSKDEILAATRQAGEPLLWALGVAAAALTAYYSFRLLALAFLGPEGPAVQATSSRRAGGEGPWTMLLPVGLLLVGAVAAGWLAIPGVTAVPAQVLEGTFRGQAFHPEGDSLTLTASLLAALVGVGVARARFRPSRPVPPVGPPGGGGPPHPPGRRAGRAGGEGGGPGAAPAVPARAAGGAAGSGGGRLRAGPTLPAPHRGAWPGPGPGGGLGGPPGCGRPGQRPGVADRSGWGAGQAAPPVPGWTLSGHPLGW